MNKINNKDLINFIEQNSGIKLLPYQKIFLKAYCKINDFSIFYGGRHYTKKLDTYILLLNRVLYMKDDETICIATPKEIKTYTREELCNWLENDYWK